MAAVLKIDQETPGMGIYGRTATWSHSKTAIFKPSREASGETSPAGPLISDFQPLGPRESKSLLSDWPSPWYFVTAAWLSWLVQGSQDNWGIRHCCTVGSVRTRTSDGSREKFLVLCTYLARSSMSVYWINLTKQLVRGKQLQVQRDSLWQREGKLKEFSVSSLYFFREEVKEQLDWVCYLGINMLCHVSSILHELDGKGCGLYFD